MYSLFRARAIIVRDNCIALIKRQREGRIYYVIPGGGMEFGETPEQTAIRESREELGLHIEIERPLAEINFHGRLQYYFLAHVTGGKFGTGEGPEMIGKYPPERGTYTPVWIPLRSVMHLNLFPPAIAEIVCLAAYKGWPAEKVQIIIAD
jgi:ADP-ribose pyrophosphatase YjhB (NUDIX family)